MEQNEGKIGWSEPPPPASEQTVAGVGAAGGLLAVIAVGLSAVADEKVDQFRALLSVLGMIVAGSALPLRYRWPPAWLIASLVCFIAGFGLPHSWDSFRMAAFVFSGVALLGALFVALPFRGRMVLASALAMIHFTGIFVAVSSPPQTPYLISQAWTYIYRPYLQFCYLSNAYHFYSPDPGPATELWFCIEFEPRPDDPVSMLVMQTKDGKPVRDGSGQVIYKPMTDASGQLVGEPIMDANGNLIYKEEDYKDKDGNILKKPIYEDVDEQTKPRYVRAARWIKLPRRERDFKDPLGQSYYRRLGLTEYAAQSATSISELPEPVQQELQARRLTVARDYPILPNWPIAFQCKLPSPMTARLILPSYVRYIAHKYRQSDVAVEPAGDGSTPAQAQRPPSAVASVKVYRVLHWITDPQPFVGQKVDGKRIGTNLKEPITYLPYFMGAFDRDGELLNKNDPLLYWLLPIVRNAQLADYADLHAPMTLNDYNRLYLDYVYKHAGTHHMQGELAP
jgi:hypothetical protein